MAFLFGGSRPSGQDSLRDYQRRIAGSARGMEREIGKLDRQEKQLLRELSKYGAEGKIELATTKAKEMVRGKGDTLLFCSRFDVFVNRLTLEMPKS